MTSRAQQLVDTISVNLSKVEGFLSSHGLLGLSIEQDVPLQYQSNTEFATWRDAALLACKELSAMLSGSFGALSSQTASEFANTQAICRFKIASSFPEGRDTATYNELAEHCGLPEQEVRRIVRATLPSYIFCEKERGVVSHTAASRMLANNPLMVQWIEMTAAEILPAALKIADAVEKWPRSGEPNQAGYNLANHTNQTAFEHMAKFPGRPERFAKAMSLFSMGLGYSPRWLVEHYPWDRIRAGTVVDIGGSKGEYSIAIAQKHPQINCIVQDLPTVIANAEAEASSELGDRVSFMAHDFFTEQPVKGADVYLMRWILHDWSDAYAIRILRALVPALGKHSKVVLHEYILPEPGAVPTMRDRTLRIFDTAVRALTNGKEREAEDWKSLCTEADGRFRVENMEKPPMSDLGIIVVGWES